MHWHHRQVKSLFLSDFHLGFPGGRARRLLQFLKATEAETIYLLGDIVDGVSVNHLAGFNRSERSVMDLLLRRAEKGTQVLYAPGNHDISMRRVSGRHVLGIEIRDSFDFVTMDGKRFLATHGDRFDRALTCNNLKYQISAWSYALAQGLDRARGHAVRSVRGRSRSWCRAVKMMWPGVSSRFRTFEENAAHHARALGYDGVICGHTHTPKRRIFDDGFIYLNTGDWVDHCTACIESLDGGLSLVTWDPTFTCFQETERIAITA